MLTCTNWTAKEDNNQDSTVFRFEHILLQFSLFAKKKRQKSYFKGTTFAKFDLYLS